MSRYLIIFSMLLVLPACATMMEPITPAPATEKTATTTEYMLDNGLKLIVQENHRAPVVVSQIWYKVGSSYEHDGITGVSHVLEHMMFKGTKKYAPGEFSRIISRNGGRENAFTSRDYTAYFQQLEKSRLKISFELEADRMRNINLTEEEFRKEVEVVKEERRLRTEDDPQSLTYEQFIATAFLSSPYRNPVIGWMNDLDNLQLDDLKAWYKKWYAPNNATLVVVGDVYPEEVYQLALKYFGPLKPSVITPPKPRTEFKQQGKRQITIKAPAELPYILMGYKVPSLNQTENEWEAYALEVLAGILGGSDSARLPRQLVRQQQIAASASASYNLTARLRPLFILYGLPTQEHSITDLQQALEKQIQQLQDTAVTQNELARIKAQVIASKVYERDSVFYQAMQMGTLETVGLSWTLLDEYVSKLEQVSAEQIQAVARKYLIDTQLTIAILDPQPLDKTSHQPKRPSQGQHRH